jgi:DNA-binding winged helix-turn-helix (wHTH) protein
VSETSLAALVTQLRKALIDTSPEARIVRTLHRVGYAFTGGASMAGEASTAAPMCRFVWRGTRFDVAARRFT